ncbi:hypothetical protein BHE90_015219 [Fusarium euwallaceae]|uniref:Uncharacterized protein n=1 Tax=Fusarium euwallaceae TaxID=1147111 RepID=A0A430L3V0_9HYPO|nr:hypothetical protein BHE90_015219 [Fusarium euwallaceae]
MGDEQLSQSDVDKCRQIIEDSFGLFTAQLQQPWKLTKTPYGLDDALKALQPTLRGTQQLATSEDRMRRLETEAIFLRAGFQAWLAYFLTDHYRGRHYTGQQVALQTVEAFRHLSREDRTKVAKELAGFKCHETVEQEIKKLMTSRKRQSKLLLMLDEGYFNVTAGLIDETYDEQSSDYAMNATNATISSLPSVGESLPLTDSAMPRLSSVVEGLPPTDDAMAVSTTDPNTTIWNLPPTDGAMTVSTTSGTLGFDPASDPATAFKQAQQCTLGSYQGLMDFFPPYLCSAVPAKDGKANVTMDFPHATKHGLKLHCLMSLVIKASEVPHITMGLFHVHIGIGDDNIRHQVLPNGGRGLARKGFQFQGSLDDDIDRILGPKMVKAIAKSPVREAELGVGIVATRCVTINFSDNPLESGILNLSLGLEYGLKMREKLFG